MRTPSQTVGPYFAFGLCTRPQNELPGVLDGEAAPIGDAMLELWSPEHGWGRCGTDGEGAYSFLVPGAADRFEVLVFARGLLKPGVTRVYLAREADAEDASLVAARDGDGYRFDVRMQGDGATAFFEL